LTSIDFFMVIKSSYQFFYHKIETISIVVDEKSFFLKKIRKKNVPGK